MALREPLDQEVLRPVGVLILGHSPRFPFQKMPDQSRGAWGEVSGDPVTATAILDRLLRHFITVSIRGDSYRLKARMKAGLLRSKIATEATTG